jgi:hypothetical protein
MQVSKSGVVLFCSVLFIRSLFVLYASQALLWLDLLDLKEMCLMSFMVIPFLGN